MLLKKISGVCACVFLCASLSAQTHSSASLDNQVYYILEQAELRGLCTPLSGIRPYTYAVLTEKINEVLNSEKADRLGGTEREILQRSLEKFSKPKTGMDWRRGAFFGETTIGKNNAPLSVNAGLSAELEGSGGFYFSDANYYGMEFWLSLYLNGDLGRHVSYHFIFEGGIIRTPRKTLGTYNTYYEGFLNPGGVNSSQNEPIVVFSEPLTHFPYTYKKRWDSSIFYFSNLPGYQSWPDNFAGCYNLPAELTASFLSNRLILRLGRISHDWSSTSSGSSLAFNQMARPFLAIEAEFNPVTWFGAAFLTGFLEYYNSGVLKSSAMNFQNVFSIGTLQFKIKNYFFIDIVDAVVWPKRLELGYFSPVTSNFFYQNNAGDFDNMAIGLNLKAQYPGVGSLWVSLFIDEIDLTSEMFTQDRQMFAAQAGIKAALPFLSFTSIKMTYTKINPYCYTHPRGINPWYGSLLMETAYVNNGAGLGYYLPPNSDEILFRFETMPAEYVRAYTQYQLIRHGADFGPDAVDGSNIASELYYGGIGVSPEYKRYFLRDGAYQWSHIIRIGAEWNLPGLPISLFSEAGLIFLTFTGIEGPANSGKPSSYSRINTSDYRSSNSFIASIGVKVFPR